MMPTTSQNPTARIAIEPDFAWDGQDAYLFDIDGTLLRSRDRVHFDSFAASVQRVTGFEITLGGILLHGNTDTAILREACRQAGIPAQLLEERVDAILEAMRNSVAERRHELDLALMPGVEDVLRHLAQKVPFRRLQRSLPDPRGAHRPCGVEGARDGPNQRVPRPHCVRGRRHAARHRGRTLQLPSGNCRGHWPMQL
jgi:hypothetical protein